MPTLKHSCPMTSTTEARANANPTSNSINSQNELRTIVNYAQFEFGNIVESDQPVLFYIYLQLNIKVKGNVG